MRFRFESTAVFCRMLLALILFLFGSLSAQAQCNVAQIHKLLADDGAAGDQFGAVGISGTLAIVGADIDDDNGDASGSAYLFDTTTGQQLFKLLPNDGEAGDRFGRVGIDGILAIVGAPEDDDIENSAGSAYLFETNSGQQIAKLLPDPGVSAVGANFGTSVAINGSTAIVGARYEDTTNGTASGAAYLFDTTTGQQINKLLPDDGQAFDSFGRVVAISGTTAIVGQFGLNDSPGAAYLFDTTTGQQLAKLQPADGEVDDSFGRSVAISGTTAIVGSTRDDDNGTDSGSAYVFDVTTGQQIFKLLATDGAAFDSFGGHVAISSNMAIVGAQSDDDNGENSGSAYLFETTTGQQLAKILPNDGAGSDGFGGAIGISGTTAVVGARFDDDNGTDTGSAYLFDVSILTSCPVHFEYPNARPNLVDSSGGTTMRVVVVNGGGEPQPNTGVLHVDRGSGFEAFPMNEVGDNVYDAVFPSSGCGTVLNYYVSAESTSGEQFSDPPDAPATSYSVISAQDNGEIEFADDFEADLGWTVTGDATDGNWDRGVPAGDGTRGDPLADGDGSGSCYLTDNVAGNSDVDNGSTVLTSPILDATGPNPILSYYRWYSNQDEDDLFVVEISNDAGASWSTVETIGPSGMETRGGWFLKTFRLSDFILSTDQMRVRFTASDTGQASIVEAGIDAVEIRLFTCDAVNVVHANQYTVYRGFHLSGELSDTFESDDSYLKFNPGFTINSAEAPVWLIFDGTLPSDSPTSLEIVMESQAGTPGLTHTLEAWNWTSAAYDVVDVSVTGFNNDVVVTVDLSSGITDYSQSGTGAVRTRVGWRKTGLIINFPWEVRLDQMIWTAGN